MTQLSNNAKLACLLAGAAASVLVFLLFTPKTDFKELEAYELDFSPDWDAQNRDRAREQLLTAAATDPATLCDTKERKWLRTTVTNYYSQRALSLAIAERYLSIRNTEALRLKWDGPEGDKIRSTVVAVAQQGLIARADFIPTTYPELAAILDPIPPVADPCKPS
jgi:hypothetical protein